MTAHKTDQRPDAAHGLAASTNAVPNAQEVTTARTEPAWLRLQRQVGNQQVAGLLRQTAAAASAGDVDPAVEQAIDGARSTGSQLHDGVRRQMEGAMGADFSAVRVHADARADTLSRALNARAFATGTDIFFREGEYNPGSSSGRELLAHELTHVVQSGAGVRAKLAVSDPGDEAELEADAVAKAVIQNEHMGASSDVAPRLLAAGGTAPGQVHRFLDEAKEIAGGLLGIPVTLPAKPFDAGVGATPKPASVKGGADAHVSLVYDGKDAPPVPDRWFAHSAQEEMPRQTMTVERGRKGIVTLNIRTWWHTEDAPEPQSGISDGTVSAHFSCDDDGTITFEPAIVTPAGGGGSVVTPFSTGVPAGPNLLATSGVELTQTTTQTGSKSQDRSSGESNSGGSEKSGSVKASGGVKVVDVEVEGGYKSTYGQGNERKSSEQRGNSTSLQVAGTNRLKFQRSVGLVAGPPKRLGGGMIDGFAHNGSQFPSAKINQLGKWWATLDTDLKNSVRSGSVGVLFVGHADEPGPPGHNLKLGTQRAQAVEREFKEFAGKDIVSRLESLGNSSVEDAAADGPAGESKKPKSNPHERRVDFELYRAKK